MDNTRRLRESTRAEDPRSPFRRDRDRVLYSTHFARLAEITQVVSPDRGYVFHNRLTHSLKVAQLARTIAEIFVRDHGPSVDSVGGIDADAAEAAGLTHDLGHPPFGHIAEEELNSLVRRAGLIDGFEGNAQSFRIACRLAVSDAVTEDGEEVVPVEGLNFTRATLAGTIKYPWGHGENPRKPSKWGYYAEDKAFFDWARNGCTPLERTITSEVMDWADDITYAIHDLLDFYRAGLIPLELVRKADRKPASPERERFLTRVFKRRSDWKGRRSGYEDALDAVLDGFPFDESHRYTGELSDDRLLYQFATLLITRYANAITPNRSDSSTATIDRDARHQVDMLKEFIWEYVILNPEMAQLQAGQRRAIEVVFGESLQAAKRKQGHFFPSPFRQLVESASETETIRLAADYVAGLTERELMRANARFRGITSQ